MIRNLWGLGTIARLQGTLATAGALLAESLVVPNITHLLQIQNPRSVGEGLAAFFARHALAETAIAR